MNEKICIVVPVYNVEKYVEKCIESIIAQSYPNLEVIIVNDGSTDNSLNVCIESSKNDNRIKVVSKKNGGLSDARNFGMRFCTCELITFIDSDDYVSKDYIKNLYELMVKYNADISCTNYINFYEDNSFGNKVKHNYIKIFDSKDAIIDVLYQKNIANSAWGKLYKYKLFEDVSFPKGKLCEDLGTFYKLFERASTVVYSSFQDYFYLQRKTSIMGSNFSEKKLDALEFANEIYSRYEEKKIKKAAESRICAECVNLLNQIPDDNKKVKSMVINELKKYYLNVIFDYKAKAILKFKIICKIVGVKNGYKGYKKNNKN